MKKLKIAALITASVVTLAACNSDSNSETVAETDAGNITQEEFYDALVERFGADVLRELITVKVLEDQYEVTDEMVQAEVDKSKEQFGDSFDMILQQNQINGEEEYAEIIYVSLLQEQALVEDIEVTDEEIEEQYDRLNTEIDAQHILVADEETANEVLDQLNDGGDFGELAEEYSMDEASAVDEGNVGYFSAGSGQMVPEFEEAAYNMEVDDISDPVQSEYGFHIIKVNDKRESEDIGTLEDERENIRRDLAAAQIDPATATAKIDELIQNADVNIEISDLEDIFEPEEEPEIPQPQG